MEKDLNYLINKANILRKHVIEMVARQGKGYVQQGLGASDLFSVLFFLPLLQCQNEAINMGFGQ